MSGQGDHLTESTFGGGEFTLQVKELGYCGDGDTLGNKVWPSAPRTVIGALRGWWWRGRRRGGAVPHVR